MIKILACRCTKQKIENSGIDFKIELIVISLYGGNNIHRSRTDSCGEVCRQTISASAKIEQGEGSVQNVTNFFIF